MDYYIALIIDKVAQSSYIIQPYKYTTYVILQAKGIIPWQYCIHVLPDCFGNGQQEPWKWQK